MGGVSLLKRCQGLLKRIAGGVAQWLRTCLRYVRRWVQSLHTHTQTMFGKKEHCLRSHREQLWGTLNTEAPGAPQGNSVALTGHPLRASGQVPATGQRLLCSSGSAVLGGWGSLTAGASHSLLVPRVARDNFPPLRTLQALSQPH